MALLGKILCLMYRGPLQRVIDDCLSGASCILFVSEASADLEQETGPWRALEDLWNGPHSLVSDSAQVRLTKVWRILGRVNKCVA